jgi:hypothetical protein
MKFFTVFFFFVATCSVIDTDSERVFTLGEIPRNACIKKLFGGDLVSNFDDYTSPHTFGAEKCTKKFSQSCMLFCTANGMDCLKLHSALSYSLGVVLYQFRIGSPGTATGLILTLIQDLISLGFCDGSSTDDDFEISEFLNESDICWKRMNKMCPLDLVACQKSTSINSVNIFDGMCAVSKEMCIDKQAEFVSLIERLKDAVDRGTFTTQFRAFKQLLVFVLSIRSCPK